MKPLFKLTLIVILISGMAIYLSSCKKEVTPPDVITIPVTDITPTSALAGVTLTNDGGSEVTLMGICWSTSPNPTINSNTVIIDDGIVIGTFTRNLNGLAADTKYYVRAFATNSAGTSYGNEFSFTTSKIVSGPTVPQIKTISVKEITVASAVIRSSVTTNGGLEIIDKGVCWATSADPTTNDGRTSWGSGTGTFSARINGLLPSVKYYARAYAINDMGTSYGEELSFTTLAVSPILFNSELEYGSVSDSDGNIYKTIQIGTQTWMAENLRTTKFNDGTSIPNVTEVSEWVALTTPAFCWYNNVVSFRDTYGGLYNWYAVNTDKLCPAGWHVPTIDEWKSLSDYLGTDAGGKMKETGTGNWVDPDPGASNLSGFTAVPAGSREAVWDLPDHVFDNIGYYTAWWSATEDGPNAGNTVGLYTKESNFYYSWITAKVSGLSVRCLKD
ncbi:MAG: fibrobacter succinogenes major paralogous domain-containing protein [Bacteroidales bacterium]|jgi:uncharacterized protein (TIGR02145 family)|nr:fibrobacter succinogenes major paralogous domain-containing protein [Bacteroidales bacterium]